MRTLTDQHTAAEPSTVRWAAGALAAYAVVVLAYATISQMQTGWEAAATYPRALIRAGGMALVTWGVLQRMRWAWWLAVALSGFWAVGSVVSLGVMFNVTGLQAAEMLPDGLLMVMSTTTVLLVAAVILLCLPRSRRAFKTRVADTSFRRAGPLDPP
jgi:hypothetical protein